ncbi:MAG: hypothetical protein O7C75_06475 [Verrucomicrobia bacterium]|nr:hypothetical protein [Verrucomicrobiota bacterium]
MPNILIRNLPEDLHARLKEKAKLNKRSINQEVITELTDWNESVENAENVVERSKARMRNAAKQIDRLRKKMTLFLSAEQIDEAIREGRK